MERKTVIVAGLGAILGGLASYFLTARSIEEKVEELYRKNASISLVDFHLTTNHNRGLDIPELFSRASEIAEQRVYHNLANKVGFQYKTNLKEKEGERRTDYNFEVKNISGLGIYQLLMIRNGANNSITDESSIIIWYRIGELQLDIQDNQNNTNIKIKNRDGKLEFNPAEVDESTARKLYDVYSAQFLAFKVFHNIDDKIDAYTRTTEVYQNLGDGKFK
ncbi:MAG: hypothetical protein AABX19_00685 [Nanoarchaeota archaeon]